MGEAWAGKQSWSRRGQPELETLEAVNQNAVDQGTLTRRSWTAGQNEEGDSITHDL